MIIMVLLIVSLSIFIIGPFLLILGSKIFKTGTIYYKKALAANLWIFFATTLLYIISGFLGTRGTFATITFSLLGIAVSILVVRFTFKVPLPAASGVVLFSLLVSVLFSFLVMTFVVQAYDIPARAVSMEPTILPGDRVFVNKFIYRFREPERGDLVTFRVPGNPGKHFVKRVAALGGEVLEIREGKVVVDGKPLDLPFHTGEKEKSFGPITIPPGCYFVLGDNLDHSMDSRYFDCVPPKNMLGAPALVIWSRDAATGKVRWGRLGSTFTR